MSGSCEGSVSAERRNASTSAWACAATSSGRSRYASAIARKTCRNAGSPCRGWGGKYVPPKNGSPPGVRKTVSGQPPCPVSETTASMYTASTSGRSSRSTLIQTKSSFMSAAVAASSNDSRSIT